MGSPEYILTKKNTCHRGKFRENRVYSRKIPFRRVQRVHPLFPGKLLLVHPDFKREVTQGYGQSIF